MSNVFDIISNYLKSNSQKTYGDILEQKSDTELKTNMLKQVCTSDEYEIYEQYQSSDRTRLLNDNANLTDKYNPDIAVKTPPKTVVVSGIGKVQQIC